MTVVSWALNGTTTLDEKIATLQTSLFAALGNNVGTSLYTFGVDGPSRMMFGRRMQEQLLHVVILVVGEVKK